MGKLVVLCKRSGKVEGQEIQRQFLNIPDLAGWLVHIDLQHGEYMDVKAFDFMDPKTKSWLRSCLKPAGLTFIVIRHTIPVLRITRASSTLQAHLGHDIV